MGASSNSLQHPCTTLTVRVFGEAECAPFPINFLRQPTFSANQKFVLEITSIWIACCTSASSSQSQRIVSALVLYSVFGALWISIQEIRPKHRVSKLSQWTSPCSESISEGTLNASTNLLWAVSWYVLRISRKSCSATAGRTAGIFLHEDSISGSHPANGIRPPVKDFRLGVMNGLPVQAIGQPSYVAIGTYITYIHTWHTYMQTFYREWLSWLMTSRYSRLSDGPRCDLRTCVPVTLPSQLGIQS